MEIKNDETGTKCCYSCFCKNDEKSLCPYKLQSTLKEIFQVENITLCFLCRRVAQHAEAFIQNVQSNQILLDNIHMINNITLSTIKKQIHPLINLEHCPLDVIETNSNESFDREGSHTVVYNTKSEVKVKLEVKYEENDVLDNLNDHFVDDDKCHSNNDHGTDLDSHVKEEDEYPLILLQKELGLEGIDIQCLNESSKKGKCKKKRKQSDSKLVDLEVEDLKIVTVLITREQCIEERSQAASTMKYINSTYKCEDCIKGFTFKGSFDKHMAKHNNGDYECDICKQRRTSQGKLKYHQRTHTLRFKCLECGLLGNCRKTLSDHYRAKHYPNICLHSCSYCAKGFKKQVSLRKHVNRVHKQKEKVKCHLCNKTYSCKETLKKHIVLTHPETVSAAEKKAKKHTCEECGCAFSAPSQLKCHMVKHSPRRDYYCVECDKSFKTDSTLKHHLKTAMPHTNYLDLPLACAHCPRRFAIRRDLTRHLNRVHLNIKPFQCDQCDKAYVSTWSLREHARRAHAGCLRARRFPCPMCDKLFDRKQIVKAHIRTHTGERPYACARCPAAFAQAGVRATHVRLVHLRLPRREKQTKQ